MFKVKKNLKFTDLKLLHTIEELYSNAYLSQKGKQNTTAQNIGKFQYVEIDCKKIAKKLHTDADIVFERLNFHLNKKYQYKQNDDSCVPLFYFGAKNICNGKHCIRFPYLCAILAHLEEEQRTQNLTLCISIISIIISILTAIVHSFET